MPDLQFRYLFCVLLFVLLFSMNVNGQENNAENDTIESKIHSPRKAILYSAIFPGLGQIYNKKIWKVPLIYGGAGMALFYINFNQIRYQKVLDYIKSEVELGEYEIYGQRIPQDRLEVARDFYRTNRDWSVIALGGTYLINILDALVDAYLFNYDVSDDLSLKLTPACIKTDLFANAIGLSLNLKF